jgi:hypothetical protein
MGVKWIELLAHIFAIWPDHSQSYFSHLKYGDGFDANISPPYFTEFLWISNEIIYKKTYLKYVVIITF